MKQGTVAGALADFALMMIIFTIINLLFQHGLNFASWDIQETQITYNTTLAAVLAVGWLVRRRFF
ncbi:hypothetical protein A6F68_01392 [Tsuneonella dongtanensis]|uniref:Uncharacterized protein n=1 Tax=Tsuneonella dongtanensis TaxID=692370 RepID=A0A1B2ACT3_9SPHN|nr:hypothetical protein [Tsuneonella dongtanensis]ANY19908.1 hypothetical protein A6F68_01392 [Tsuneonella dongtanensis]